MELKKGKFYEFRVFENHEELIKFHIITKVIKITDDFEFSRRKYLLQDVYAFSDYVLKEWSLLSESLDPKHGEILLRELTKNELKVYLI